MDYKEHKNLLEEAAVSLKRLRQSGSNSNEAINHAATAVNIYNTALKAYDNVKKDDPPLNFAERGGDIVSILKKCSIISQGGSEKDRQDLKERIKLIERATKQIANQIITTSVPFTTPTRKHDMEGMDPEMRLFWLAHFYGKKKVPMEEFWGSLKTYLACTHGYPKLDIEESDAVAETIENSLRTVMEIGEEGKTAEVTTKNYLHLMARFGPLSDILNKVCVCSDFLKEGEATKHFHPKQSQDRKYFANNGVNHYYRYSRQFGKLVYETPGQKTLITNSVGGYSIKGQERSFKNIPNLLKNSARRPECEKAAAIWYTTLKGLGNWADADNYGSIQNEAQVWVNTELVINEILQITKENQSIQEGNAEKLNEMQKLIGEVKTTVINFGMENLSMAPDFFPRLYLVFPADNLGPTEKQNVFKKAKNWWGSHTKSTWKIHVLCEGHSFGTKGEAQSHIISKDVHAGYEIELPNAKFAKCIPYIRVSIQILIAAINLTPAGDTVVGIAEACSEMGVDTLTELHELYENTREYVECDKSDEELVKDNKLGLLQVLSEHDDIDLQKVRDGECGPLTFCYSDSEGKTMWLCEKCKDGTAGLRKGDFKNVLDVESVRDARESKEDESITPMMSLPKHRRADSIIVREYPTGASQLVVEVISATGLIDADIGYNNFSDPFCHVIPMQGDVDDDDKQLTKMKKATTKVINDNLDPIWEEQFTWPLDPGSPESARVRGVRFEVFDQDPFNKTDPLGLVFVKLPLKGYWGVDQSFNLQPLEGQKETVDSEYGSIAVKIYFQ